MKIYEGLNQIKEKVKAAIVTIGNFDGVHCGHVELISRAKRGSLATGRPLVVMTFAPHPLTILAPQKDIKRIFSLKDQCSQLQGLGVDILLIEPFNRALANMSAEEFIRQKIIGPFSPKNLVVGYDFTFGKGREGTTEYLQRKSHEFGFEVEVVAALKIENTIVSSSEIRRLIENGNIVKANRFLGRRFYLEGKIGHGASRGQEIGFPTANLDSESEIFPKFGVYVTKSYFEKKEFESVSNVGVNPTFADKVGQHPKVETFIFDYSGKIYDKPFRLEFLDYLRPEKKFSGISELKEQIKIDIELTKDWFKKNGR